MPNPISYKSPTAAPPELPTPEFKYILAATTLLFLTIAAAVATFFLYGNAIEARQARLTVALTDLATLKSVLDAFAADTGRYPTSAESLDALITRPSALPADRWKGPYMQRLPSDPWAHPYHYTSPAGARPFDLRSAGPDGTLSTPDDLTT